MISEFYKGLDFPDEACRVLQESYEIMTANSEAAELLRKAEDSFFAEGDESFSDFLQKTADITGVHRFVVDMVFLLMCAGRLRGLYDDRGLSRELFWDTLRDLRYKLIECHDVYGVWGTFVTGWFKCFFTLGRFALGRLQFERASLRYDDYRGFAVRGHEVVNFHIPSSGALTPESVLDSLHRAYEFYRDECLTDGIMLFTCYSWLIYPPQYKVYPEGSNLQKFYNMFDIVEAYESDDFGDFWRVFNMEYSPEAIDRAPTDTRLRRNLISYIKEGSRMGCGFGIIAYDGTKIIKL